MAKKTTITRVDRVSLPEEGKSKGKPLDPSKETPENGGKTEPSQKTLPGKEVKQTQPVPKKGPGRRTLAPEDKLNDDFIEKIRKKVDDAVNGKGADWNIGGVPPRPGDFPGGDFPVPRKDGPEKEGREGEGPDVSGPGRYGPPKDGPSIGQPVELPPGGDSRVWVDPETLEKEIDEANRRGEDNERIADSESEKEQRTDTEKTMGGKGKGRGRVRDRIAVERLSQTDWAAIFKTKLTAYSNENAKYLPWNRRFVAQPKTLGRKIGSKTPERDVIPELNLLVDTSSSLSYREMAVVLGEIEKAMEAAKINSLNVFLWAGEPYAYKEFKKVSKKNFKEVNDWIQSKWTGGGNDEFAIYNEIIKKGKAKKFTISLTDAYLEDHMRPGKLKDTWTKALDPANLIFAIVYPNKSISYENWLNLGNRMPGTKVPVFLDSKKFR